MAESEQGNQKVLIVAERYSTTSGGFIDSLRAALKDLPAADDASMPDHLRHIGRENQGPA